MPKTLTRLEFGKARRLSPGRVSQLIAEGLPVADDNRIDPKAADAWIAKNIDLLRREAEAHGRSAGTGKLASIADARREKLAADAALARLELKKREGELVSREAAERFVLNKAREERDALITWAARAAPALADELDCEPQTVFAALDRLLREHLLERSQAKASGL